MAKIKDIEDRVKKLEKYKAILSDMKKEKDKIKKEAKEAATKKS